MYIDLSCLLDFKYWIVLNQDFREVNYNTGRLNSDVQDLIVP
jgi:hypothetical protein